MAPATTRLRVAILIELRPKFSHMRVNPDLPSEASFFLLVP